MNMMSPGLGNLRSLISELALLIGREEKVQLLPLCSYPTIQVETRVIKIASQGAMNKVSIS